MRVTRETIFWIVVGVASFLAVLLLHEILLPFVVGAIGAFILVPVIDKLESRGINRSLATLGIVFILASALIVSALLIFPAAVGEIRFLVHELPKYVARIQAIALGPQSSWLHELGGEELQLERSAAEIAKEMGGDWLSTALRSVWSSGLAVFSLLSLLVVAPIITIYLLIDWKRLIATVDGWIAPHRRADVHAIVGEINATISAFMRGQATICIVLAAFYAVGLSILGLRHAIALGLLAGLISFVPYLGAATGLVVATLIAVVQFWPNWIPAVLVVCIFVVGEGIADYVLSPRIVGRRVRLHPIWLIFALSAFGLLFGFVGLLVAVPVAASLGVILRFAFARSKPNSGVQSGTYAASSPANATTTKGAIP
jgi:predicted PurR-regulated permease PerM